jgi:subtilisin family serine protease
MKERLVTGIACLVALILLIAGCTWLGVERLDPQSLLPERAYIVEFNKLPKHLDVDIAALGGRVTGVLEQIDVAVVSSSREDFADLAAGLPGVIDVLPDLVFEFAVPRLEEVEPEAGPESEPYFGYQWGMLAIDAPGAWDAGHKGGGARVAVLDTGVDYTHPDLAANVDLASSASMVPYDPSLIPVHWHATHVAGIVAADDNGVGVTGVAPDAEIISVKVFGINPDTGALEGFFSWTLAGILHAVDVGADVINMSLGGYIAHSEPPANEVNAFINLVKKTVNYADQQGVFVVCSAGNDALDGQGDRGFLHIPSDVGSAVCISATGPIGWIFDPSTDLDVLAIYSNYGPQIDFAAPGGNDVLWPEPGWHYDMVLSSYPGGWAWADGTSMSAPHVAGVAALIIGKNGGDMSPQHVLRDLRLSSDDLGKPGQDVYYGYGRVNAARAVGP